MIYIPLDYASLARNAPESNLMVNDQERLAEFFTANMENDALGRVSHLHVAISDYLLSGACDPLALELAESQSMAVDFPKTGIKPKVPKKALDLVRAVGYPDFMEKPKKSYVSDKLLGKLYRRVDEVAVDDSEFLAKDWLKAEPDPALIVPDRSKFIHEAELIYRHYCYDLVSMLLKLYFSSLLTEGRIR
jgi:hypothetical protein